MQPNLVPINNEGRISEGFLRNSVHTLPAYLIQSGSGQTQVRNSM